MVVGVNKPATTYDRRKVRRTMTVLLVVSWTFPASTGAGAVLLWLSSIDSQRWAPAIISTAFAVLLLGSSIHLTVLLRRSWRDQQREGLAGNDQDDADNDETNPTRS